MSEVLQDFLSAFALIFVIEGLLYAVFPDFVRRLMAMALSMDIQQLRVYGLGMAGLGALLLWVFRHFL